MHNLAAPTFRLAPFPVTATWENFSRSALLCTAALVVFLAISEPCRHIFIFPVLVCGILIGMDAVAWARGHMDLFDPVGILGLYGLHFFFLAPLLHVALDFWMQEVAPPPDWREALGTMALFNALGLLVYRVSRQWLAIPAEAAQATEWRLNRHRFGVVVGLALLATGTLQLLVYASFGGIVGFIESAFEGSARSSMSGMGPVFMISESFPILAMMAFAVLVGPRSRQSWILLGSGLLAFLALKILFGGLRGSRSNTIWGLFWAVGIVHWWVRPVSKKLVVAGVLFFLGFMYLYGFVKDSGLDGLEKLAGGESLTQMESKTGRTMTALLLGDLGRSDAQAFLLHRLTSPDCDFQYSWGRTYFASAVLVVPKSLWPNRPALISKEVTEVMYGMGSFVPVDWESGRIYGLTGEAVLNFGVWAMPVSFVVLGLVVGWVRRLITTMGPGDSRWLLAPYLVLMAMVVLIGCSDNIVFDLLKQITIPFVVILLSSTKVARGELS